MSGESTACHSIRQQWRRDAGPAKLFARSVAAAALLSRRVDGCTTVLMKSGIPSSTTCDNQPTTIQECQEVASQHLAIASDLVVTSQTADDRPRGCWYQYPDSDGYGEGLYWNEPLSATSNVACSAARPCVCCSDDVVADLTTTVAPSLSDCSPAVVSSGRPYDEGTCPRPMESYGQCQLAVDALSEAGVNVVEHSATDRPTGCWWQDDGGSAYYNLATGSDALTNCSADRPCICCDDPATTTTLDMLVFTSTLEPTITSSANTRTSTSTRAATTTTVHSTSASTSTSIATTSTIAASTTSARATTSTTGAPLPAPATTTTTIVMTSTSTAPSSSSRPVASSTSTPTSVAIAVPSAQPTTSSLVATTNVLPSTLVATTSWRSPAMTTAVTTTAKAKAGTTSAAYFDARTTDLPMSTSSSSTASAGDDSVFIDDDLIDNDNIDNDTNFTWTVETTTTPSKGAYPTSKMSSQASDEDSDSASPAVIVVVLVLAVGLFFSIPLCFKGWKLWHRSRKEPLVDTSSPGARSDVSTTQALLRRCVDRITMSASSRTPASPSQQPSSSGGGSASGPASGPGPSPATAMAASASASFSTGAVVAAATARVAGGGGGARGVGLLEGEKVGSFSNTRGSVPAELEGIHLEPIPGNGRASDVDGVPAEYWQATKSSPHFGSASDRTTLLEACLEVLEAAGSPAAGPAPSLSPSPPPPPPTQSAASAAPVPLRPHAVPQELEVEDVSPAFSSYALPRRDVPYPYRGSTPQAETEVGDISCCTCSRQVPRGEDVNLDSPLFVRIDSLDDLIGQNLHSIHSEGSSPPPSERWPGYSEYARMLSRDFRTFPPTESRWVGRPKSPGLVPSVDSSSALMAVSRLSLIKRLFWTLDRRNAGILNRDDVRVFAELWGFHGNSSEWDIEFRRLCEYLCRPEEEGLDLVAFIQLVNDTSRRGCFSSDADLAYLCKVLIQV